MIEEFAAIGRNNILEWSLLSDEGTQGVFLPIKLDSVNKVELIEVNGRKPDGESSVISSAVNPLYFDWSTGVVGKLVFKAGLLSNITSGKYIFKVVLYDPVNPLGIEWDRVTIWFR